MPPIDQIIAYEAGEIVFRARWEEIAPPPRQPA